MIEGFRAGQAFFSVPCRTFPREENQNPGSGPRLCRVSTAGAFAGFRVYRACRVYRVFRVYWVYRV